MAWAIQRHVDFTDCKTSLSHHGRQISESESEAQGTAKGENQQRGSEERATGLGRQGGAEKEVGGRCQIAIGKCPATLPRSRLSVNRPSRPKDQQIFRERERCNQPRSRAALLRQFPGRCEAARRGRFA